MITDKIGDGTGQPKSGFYPEVSNMTTGAGWLSIGPGYRRYFHSDDSLLIDASAAVSWHLYTMGQARIERSQLANDHLAIGLQTMWQDATQVNFFGVGPDSLEADQTQYQLKSLYTVGYAKLTPNDSVTISEEVGWLGRPKFMEAGGTFRNNNDPFTRNEFPTVPGANLDVQPAFLTTETAVAADTRNHRGHPTSGFLYRGAVTTYNDRNAGSHFDFSFWEAEGMQIIPLAGPKWLLAVRGWTIYSWLRANDSIPLYLLPSIGGNNTLRSFKDYRFHDNNILLANIESRWALSQHIDGALFLDAGNVANQYSQLNFDKTSVGGGLRLHTETTTFARLDVAHGSEGWQVLFRTSEPLRLARVRRQIAFVPFAP